MIVEISKYVSYAWYNVITNMYSTSMRIKLKDNIYLKNSIKAKVNRNNNLLCDI